MVKVIAAAFVITMLCTGTAWADASDSGTTIDEGTTFDAGIHNDQIGVGGRRGKPSKSSSASHSSTSKPVLKPACWTYYHGQMVQPGVCIPATELCTDPKRPHPYLNMTAVKKVMAELPDRFEPQGTIVCLSDASAPKPLVTEQEFRRLPIPAPPIQAQPDPVLGHTLINIETNFYTSPDPVMMSTSILGRRVKVRAIPSTYRWTYGDGAGQTTRSPGDRYPNMLTPHIYRSPGTFTVKLSTTFTGEYSVSGGPWQPIQGTATARSAPIQVTAEEHRAVLIS